MFNLADDISETNDLAKKMPEKATELSTELDCWLKATGAKLPKWGD